MKKYTGLFFILHTISLLSFSQKIKVTESTESLDNISQPGMYTIIELDKKFIEKSWVKYLKDYGKVESSKEIIKVPAANLASISNTPCKITSTLTLTTTGTKLFYSVEKDSSYITLASNETAYRAAERFLYNFAVYAYKEDINVQILDAEGALEASVKVQEKFVRSGLNLAEDLEANKNEKAELQEKLRINSEDFTRLHREADGNLAEQKAAISNLEKVKAEHAAQTVSDQKVISEATKIQEVKLKEGQRLGKALEKNKTDKINYEAKLKANAEDKILLDKSIQQNTIDQKAAEENVQKMRKAVEIVKGKLAAIEQ